eukprot:4383899-Pyramimonas_sp.AAC.1
MHRQCCVTCRRSPGTAVICCEQNKAFERISLQWMGGLPQRWKLPSWLQRALDSPIGGRRVQTCKGKYKWPERHLLRSVGMGGT